jgi:nitrogen fixation/metabolism regulation signal transduction histidine kinase
MREKYRGLVVASVLLRVAAVVVMVVGVGLCLWYLVSSERGEFARIATILGICGSLLVGIIAYSFGEVINLLLDIRDEVGDKNSKKE